MKKLKEAKSFNVKKDSARWKPKEERPPSKTGTKDDPLIGRSSKALAETKHGVPSASNVSARPTINEYNEFAISNLQWVIDELKAKGNSDEAVNDILRRLQPDLAEWISKAEEYN